jgi:hypothetical protein
LHNIHETSTEIKTQKIRQIPIATRTLFMKNSKNRGFCGKNEMGFEREAPYINTLNLHFLDLVLISHAKIYKSPKIISPFKCLRISFR